MMSRREVARRSRWISGDWARMLIYLVMILKVIHCRWAVDLSALNVNSVTAQNPEA
jgi:hypothetical protein